MAELGIGTEYRFDPLVLQAELRGFGLGGNGKPRPGALFGAAPDARDLQGGRRGAPSVQSIGDFIGWGEPELLE